MSIEWRTHESKYSGKILPDDNFSKNYSNSYQIFASELTEFQCPQLRVSLRHSTINLYI